MMIPSELKQEENGIVFKKILETYLGTVNTGEKLISKYGKMLDILSAEGELLDLIGTIYNVFRSKEISDSGPGTVVSSEVLYVGKENPELSFKAKYEVPESDENYRGRILVAVIEKKTPTTIPQIQEAINSISGEGNLYVLENHSGYPANIYITGSADSRTIDTSIKTVKSLLPAGVSLIVPIVSFDIWNNIKNQFPTWDSLDLEGYIW